jgi:glycosyltransferase involved in cell wall biosynthesis
MLKNKKSVIFIRPDYHCSFFYRDEFRKIGWKAEIFVPDGYPNNLLFSEKDILRSANAPVNAGPMLRYIRQLANLIWYLTNFWRYRYHIYYGRPPEFNFKERKLGLNLFFNSSFLVSLSLAKLFGCRLIYCPTGCHDQELKRVFQDFDDGKICGNCGQFNRCDDRLNSRNFQVIRRYFDMAVGWDPINSSEYKATHFKYKSIDLNLWHSNLTIPLTLKSAATDKIRILHSAYLGGSDRDWQDRNIKGSPYVLAAIKKLQHEGHLVEYYYIEKKPANQMRFYQAQADIVVEQLIYGWWGSTGVETMALGKPVVCYLRPSWKTFFLKTFPEYDSLPIVEADINTIYDVLKKLVTDADYRRRKGEESRRFAEAHFDPEKNAKAFAKLLETL